jgi:hypothetical protein
LKIRDRGDYPRRRLELELGLCFIIMRRTEGVGRAGAGRTLMLLGHDVGRARKRNGWPGWAGWVEFGPWPIENWKMLF